MEYEYFPIALPFFLAFWFLFAVVVVLIEIGFLQYAFETMGIGRRYMFALLVFSLLGSYINIPIAEFPATHMYSNEIVQFFGMQYVIPVPLERPRTILAVNVGGAIIPVILSLYLVIKHREFARSVIAVAIVAWVMYRMARPVPGVGIAVPTFMPPLITALVAMLLSHRHAAPLAYVAGSLGTLIGADLMNLGHIQNLGAPVASIGGAGKFDGIFLTGIIAMLLASLFHGRPRMETEQPA